MKALIGSKFHQVKYPRDTPRVSRKRLWIDRAEWRKDPQEIHDVGTSAIDMALDRARNGPTLEGTNYQDTSDLMERTGRSAIRRF